jgi:hypothetical protein
LTEVPSWMLDGVKGIYDDGQNNPTPEGEGEIES